MTYTEISELVRAQQLEIFGAFHPTPNDLAPDGSQSLILLGPHEPGFWPHFQASPEYLDGNSDPMDRWSTRVITKLAEHLQATAIFPFGGPPFQPFISWAMRSGRAWQSPAGPLVHDQAGMMVSYRGALALPYRLDISNKSENPCNTCTGKPCLTTCPVTALSAQAGYELAACHTFLDTENGQDCMTSGCAARRACPISQTYARLPEQSEFHMKSFHK